jgi:spermidine/putrescine transport system substrate-binding protein
MNKHRIAIASLTTLALSAFAFFGGGCSKAKPELHIYNWSDYFAPETIANFEAANNCKVVYDVFESNEAMYAKLKAGASGYDVVFPSSYQAYLMYHEGMTLKLDHAKLPNLANIDQKFIQQVSIDKGMEYSVPYMTGTTGIAVNKSKVPNIEDSWSIYDRSDIKGRMTLLNDYREVLGAALKYLGYSINSRSKEEIEKAGLVVKRWKANIAKFASDEYKPGIASGEFFVCHGYSGDLMQVINESTDTEIVYILPKEGFSTWADDMVIPADAPNKDLAYAFINYLHDPKVAAANMEFTSYLAPNSAAYELVPEELRKDERVFVPAEKMAHGEQIIPLGDDDKLYMDVWSKVKSQE